jgi:hypothetical protein
MVHQRVLQDICKHYKTKNPKLEFVDLETDGCASQFKGRKNFFCVAGGQFKDDAYCGMKQRHCFTAPGHGGGPVDNAGKVAKDFLNHQSASKTQSAYNYNTAYEICKKGMCGPSERKRAVTGTWGCNGEQVFGRLSNGKDESGRKRKREPSDSAVPTVPKFAGDVTVVAGCQRLFAFKQEVCVSIIHEYARPRTHSPAHAQAYTLTCRILKMGKRSKSKPGS